MKNSNQTRHEELIKFLSKFSQYQDEKGKSILETKRDQLNTSEINSIPRKDISNAVVVLTDFLNIRSGSVGDFDLYTLIQEYMSDQDSRKKINNLLKELKTDKIQV